MLIHKKEHLSDTVKLAYLKDALKDGPARTVIQGLAQMAGTYNEAIKCLQDRYDRPRLIQRAHVQNILEAQVIKSNSGKEIRCIHDVIVTQHVRALKTDKQDSFDTLLTIMIEAKMENALKLEWMKYSNEYKLTPPYSELLKFLDTQA